MISTALTLLPCNRFVHNSLPYTDKLFTVVIALLCKAFRIDQVVQPSIDNSLIALTYPNQCMDLCITIMYIASHTLAAISCKGCHFPGGSFGV